MFVDIVIAAALLLSLISGYRRGFISTLFETIGYLLGGIFGLYASLNFSHDWGVDLKRVGLLLVSIIAGGFIGSFLGKLLAKGFRATILKGPLAFLDSLAGAALETIRTIVIVYLIATVLLWAPWDTGKNAVKESQLFDRVETLLPGVITQANTWVKEEFLNLRL
jgi:uncharacterized membrane protein required for colicin V production